MTKNTWNTLKIATLETGEHVLIDPNTTTLASRKNGQTRVFKTKAGARGVRSLLQRGERPFYGNGEV